MKSNQNQQFRIEEPKPYVDSVAAISIQPKAPYAVAPLALKAAYWLVLIVVAVGVWLVTGRVMMPQWMQLVLTGIAVVGARSAMRLGYAMYSIMKYRQRLAALSVHLRQLVPTQGN